jgi:hypothetical protein
MSGPAGRVSGPGEGAGAAVRWRVQSWDPAYGATGEDQSAPRPSRVEPVLDVELPAFAWRPLDPDPGAPEPARTLFVDGVRRIDAIGWGDPGTGPDGTPTMGLFASWAAGVVCCGPDGARLLAAEVHRGLFSGAARVEDVPTSAGRYLGARVPLSAGSPPPAQQLSQAVQARMRAAEVSVSQAARTGLSETGTGVGAVADDLLVVDGPLHGRTHLPRTLGYVKTHDTYYLPAEQHRVVSALAAGQRTPVFGLADRFSWYLRLPEASGAPWAGVVRVECAADREVAGPSAGSTAGSVAGAVALADRSAPSLCRYASAEYKDARAPQNLVPIAGLERQLRRRLGDQALLHRAVRRAAAR